jgi:hypothetical protein
MSATPHMPRGGFALKPGIIALGLLIVAGLLIGYVTDAGAVVCPPPTGYKSIGSTCYYVNGVIVDTTLYFTGNLTKNPKSFSAEITPTGFGVLFCGNNGGNQAPGQRIIPFSSPLTCSVPVQSSDVDSNANGGTADHVLCDAKLSPTELDNLDVYCSTGQFAIDFIPCSFDSVVKYQSDKDGTIEQAKHHCDLPSCETLRWDNKAGMPEFRQYECVGPID